MRVGEWEGLEAGFGRRKGGGRSDVILFQLKINIYFKNGCKIVYDNLTQERECLLPLTRRLLINYSVGRNGFSERPAQGTGLRKKDC